MGSSSPSESIRGLCALWLGGLPTADQQDRGPLRPSRDCTSASTLAAHYQGGRRGLLLLLLDDVGARDGANGGFVHQALLVTGSMWLSRDHGRCL